MAETQLPCDTEGRCMVCHEFPCDHTQILTCTSCRSPWHIPCLHTTSRSLSAPSSSDWFCPDCDSPSTSSSTTTTASSSSLSSSSSSSLSSSTFSSCAPPAPCPRPLLSPHTTSCYHRNLDSDLIVRIHAVQADPHLSEHEKARRCQDIIMSQNRMSLDEEHSNEVPEKKKKRRMQTMLRIFDDNMICIFCMQLADRPVTTPCGHNFCLKCFQRWVTQGKRDCAKCRTPIPSKMLSQPRINSALVVAIRMAKSSSSPSGHPPLKPYHYIQNRDRPDKCFTTERAKKPGKSNAASGKIFVTVPPDHFGPITAANDPMRGQGVLVGETWEDRMECRQWGAHLPHVAGIAGQSDYGAQSVALSGGYEDDEDHGEWFLYTGSGGRDLSGNRRTNDKQSFDQKFEKSNLSLKLSCKNGYPVRVVRSHKEKRSSYAPESGVRYDGVYRIEKCWRKKGIQGFKVCRYLFVRCDNEPAPWTSDQIGDRHRPLPEISELQEAVDLTTRSSQPAWDWKDEEGVWGWVTAPPTSRKSGDGTLGLKCGSRKPLTLGQRLLKEFGCGLCKKVLRSPLSTPCGHNFCKSCLVGVFLGQKDIRERTGMDGRPLRTKRIVKRCPVCEGDISDFLANPQVNRQMEDVILSLEDNESDIENNTTQREEEAGLLGPDADGEKADINVDASGTGNEFAICSEYRKVYDVAQENCVATTNIGKEEFYSVCAMSPMYSEEHSMLVDLDA